MITVKAGCDLFRKDPYPVGYHCSILCCHIPVVYRSKLLIQKSKNRIFVPGIGISQVRGQLVQHGSGFLVFKIRTSTGDPGRQAGALVIEFQPVGKAFRMTSVFQQKHSGPCYTIAGIGS